ncbi:hypothetical protein B0I35DRAFT_172415 [Stachybotrys elegans]|uniref:NAD(P)-binding domain-containing protein n=1 Tax=Stachybotrys elegans TaxID=80388 RepID=A0A8K0WVY9_9HYPO|nr:hypothetical protein B0I35DRAFT_172415 [Stachybotrys elegans]
MKVIVTGATGLAGGGVVKQCLQDDRIDSLIILTRKHLSADVESNPKVQVIMHQDFSTYPDELMQKLQGADACIWCIGGRVDQFGNDKELCRRVGVDFTLAAAKAMSTHLAAPSSSGREFRFVYCSGKYAEWDQDKTLLFLGDTRRFKGLAEKGLRELAEATPGFEVWVLRPSGILSTEAPLYRRVVGKLYEAIDTAQLGRALVRVAVEGCEDKMLENDALHRMAAA